MSPTAKGRRHPNVSPAWAGDDPLQRHLVAFALALVAAILAATLAGCGGGPPDEPPDGRAAIPPAPTASAAL